MFEASAVALRLSYPSIRLPGEGVEPHFLPGLHVMGPRKGIDLWVTDAGHHVTESQRSTKAMKGVWEWRAWD